MDLFYYSYDIMLNMPIYFYSYIYFNYRYVYNMDIHKYYVIEPEAVCLLNDIQFVTELLCFMVVNFFMVYHIFCENKVKDFQIKKFKKPPT